MIVLLLLAAIISNVILAASILLKTRSAGPFPVLQTVSSVVIAEASLSAMVMTIFGAPSVPLAAVSSLALIFAVVPPAADGVRRLRSAPGNRQAPPAPSPPVKKHDEQDTMEAYTVLFERCCIYMETKKPFLVESLTLSDLANAMFTNTLYLSRTINACSGKNFRRFVNDYRVDYAMKIFRNNTSLKVTQLSMMSGFHTVITFNMAFKLVKGVSPSVWCQSVRFGAEKTAKSAPKPTSP